MEARSYPEWLYRHCGNDGQTALLRPTPNAPLLLAPDGATVNSQNAVDFHEPPTDAAAREQLILSYKRTVLAKKESELARCRTRFYAESGLDLSTCSVGDIERARCLDDETVAYLKGLKTLLATLRRDIAQLESILAWRATKAKQQAEAQRRAESQARHQEQVAQCAAEQAAATKAVA